VLTVRVPPIITLQPTNQTNLIGTTVAFAAAAIGDAPLAYRWYHNGTAMLNGSRISGATSNNLAIANAQTNDSGSYTPVVSNAVAVTTSVVASLTVLIPPSITAQPAGIAVYVGTNVNFTVQASGSPQLRYTWQKDGLNLSDGTNVLGSQTPSLNL